MKKVKAGSSKTVNQCHLGLAGTHSRQRTGEALWWTEGWCPSTLLRGWGPRKVRVDQLQEGHPVSLVGLHIWLPLVGLNFEAGTKIREAVNY